MLANMIEWIIRSNRKQDTV